MQLYLPIAEVLVNALVILGMGGMVGVLSGLFGVGGGFLMTPLLIFIGIPPAIAVGTQANQLVAASISGMMGHWRRGNVDFKLGTVMLAGSTVGTGAGVWLFGVLQALGQIDLAISLMYVFFLGTIGLLMLIESVGALRRRGRPAPRRRQGDRHTWLHGLPFRTRFAKSKLYCSALLPFAIGLVGGVLVAIMGIGGGFVLVPAMIYLLGMPVVLVAGTSLFQVTFTTAIATYLQATLNQTVDIVLAVLLILGGVIGAQLGARVSGQVSPEASRALLALIVLAVGLKLLVDLILTPGDPYSLQFTQSLPGGRP